jgi:hypothetical protein
VDVSPLLSNKSFQTTITAVTTAKFADAPPAILVGTESRGVLYSDDCGMSWYELNDGMEQSNFLGNAEVRALASSDNVVLAGVRGGDLSKGDPAKIANTIATLTPKSVARAAQIAESSRRTANDSIKANRINVLMDAAAERGLVQLSVNESQPVEVAAYNILGKKVLDIYAGEARAGANSIPFDITQLSRGMYICVVRGKSFKLAEKFLISR